jgi:hypothetical protein
MRVLFIGDIVGRPGRNAVREWTGLLRRELALDAVVANAENAAGGLGATPKVLRELLDAAGCDALTLGNHTWRKKELVHGIDSFARLVRPANYPPGTPGLGGLTVTMDDGPPLGLVNVAGRVFMEPLDCPFRAAEAEVERLRKETPYVLVDMHAEATAEKQAMGWHLAGRASAVLGTHTHVATADERILPGGTAYISDVGMVGPVDSVIGMEAERAVNKFITAMPSQFSVAKGRVMLNAVLVELEADSGKAVHIERVQRESEAG